MCHSSINNWRKSRWTHGVVIGIVIAVVIVVVVAVVVVVEVAVPALVETLEEAPTSFWEPFQCSREIHNLWSNISHLNVDRIFLI